MIEKTTSDNVKVSNRTLKAIQSGKKKSLAEAFPEIAAEWDYKKNGDLIPETVTPGMHTEVWWLGKCGHEWQSPIYSRSAGRGCHYCTGYKVLTGFNDLATTHPEIASEWHPTKNGKLTPQKVSKGYTKKVWWKCKHGHEWPATVNDRTTGKGCPDCYQGGTSNLEQTFYYYMKKYVDSKAKHRYKKFGPEIDIYLPKLKTAIEYDGRLYHKEKQEKDKDKNKILKDQGITVYRIREIPLKSLDDSSFDILYKPGSPKALNQTISKLIYILTNKEVYVDTTYDLSEIHKSTKETKKENSVAKLYPELVKEFHPTENGNRTLEMFTPGSNEKVWWKCSKCGYSYPRVIAKQTNKEHIHICTMCKKPVRD